VNFGVSLEQAKDEDEYNLKALPSKLQINLNKLQRNALRSFSKLVCLFACLIDLFWNRHSFDLDLKITSMEMCRSHKCACLLRSCYHGQTLERKRSLITHGGFKLFGRSFEKRCACF